MKHLASAVFFLVPLFCGAVPQNDHSSVGIECYKCNSNDTPDCAQNPKTKLNTKYCNDPNDQCITAIVDRITHRGCKKEVKITSDVISTTCTDSLCNNEFFPKDRLKCYQCEGTNCIDDLHDDLKPCVNYVQNDSCITDVIDETDVIRRCDSDTDFPLGTFVEMCHESGCNDHPIKSTSECITCSQANSTSCVGRSGFVQSGLKCTVPEESTCKDTLLLNRPIQCFTYLASGYVIRGCLKDAGELVQDIGNFKPCEGQLCNNKCLLIKCVKCNSRTNPKCVNNANNLEPESCLGDNACFTAKRAEGAIQRGCGERLENAKQIVTCHEDGCNNKDLPVLKRTECYNCSSHVLAECATNPSASLPHATCKDPNDNCITAIVDGSTQRGCEKEVDVPSYAISEKCNSTLCNIKVFPRDRFKCYQCEGMDCVKNFEKYLQPCAKYADNKCVTIVENESNIIRKCSLDLVYPSRSFAVTCEGSGCNNQPATYSDQCLSCTESNTTSCVRQNALAASEAKCTLPLLTTCTDAPLLGRPISCFTYKKSGAVVRGCMKDAGHLSEDTKYFIPCEGPMCNNECLPIKCISCDSKVHPRCVNQTMLLGLQQCTSAVACFVGETAEGEIIRGCGNQYAELSQMKICYSDGCNNEVLPPSSCAGANCNNNGQNDCQGNNCKNGSDKRPQNGVEKYCYQCKDSTSCRDIPDKSLLKRCASPSDGCMQYVNLMHEMVRGCKSDKDYDECLKRGKKCVQCTEDGCNNIASTKTAELFCTFCDSSDKNCIYTINKDESMKCHPQAPFYEDSFGCYSCISKDNKTANRGCYWGEHYTSNDGSTCRTCKTDDCNDESLFVQSCIQCSGDSASCTGDLSGTACKKNLYAHNVGCYAKKIGDKINRGCISDFEDPKICKGDEKFCHYCLGQDCNTSGTRKLHISLGVLLVPLLLSLYVTF